MSLSWSKAKTSELKKIKGVCLDIDETLSTHGKLTAQAFQSLWKLKQAGFSVVPITGRPAGWCDHIARFWPVDAVVGENGAFTFYMDQSVRRQFDTPSHPPRIEAKEKLNALSIALKSKFPNAQWASDQPYREADLAIDVCEDVPPWPRAKVEELLQFCREAGAQAKLSSIHVNTWFGDYDKVKGFRSWLSDFGERFPKADEWIFIGDSPNDEPMFADFKNSVGVANLKNFISQLKFPPRWITQAESGQGFSEMAKRLLESR